MKDYEDVTMEELDTSGFFYDPKDSNFVQKLHKKDPAFSFEHDPIPNSISLRYVALMYDPNSEIRNNILSYPKRKRIAAKLAGFKLDSTGKFEKIVEDMLLGQNRFVNRAIAQYCFLTLNIYYVTHAAYLDMLFRALEDSGGKYDKETRLAVDDLQKKVLLHEKMILGGEDVIEMKKALYALSRKIELDFTPEAIAKKIEKGDDLSSMNPYPNNHIPKKPKYVGHRVPQNK